MVAVFALEVVPAIAAPSVMLAPHRAVYDLQLDKADDKTGISGLKGRMVYEFNGSACEGYTTNFRFVTQVDMEEQPQRLTDQQTTTFEAADGQEFSFVNKTFVDKDLIKEVRGKAELQAKNLQVKLSHPEKADIELSKTNFPTKHLTEIIGKAEKGEKFYQTTIFDGSEDANRVVAITVMLGKEQAVKDDEYKSLGEMSNDKFWPVTIAYFDDKENQDGMPIYRINFKLYRNGVTRDLFMDYGDFSMRGKLVKLDLYKGQPADEQCS
ncbi:cell envelope integrity EipB family protein [Paenochrobactrum gallinarii]|nr:cell envelope integrity EipB family protein [Paenochrobactrum gallinarii]